MNHSQEKINELNNILNNIEKLNNTINPVCFFISDLHGTYPEKVITSLLNAGFENENKKHFVIVAGDITDGIGVEDKLINLLQALESQGQLIAVKGNHDQLKKPFNKCNYTQEQREWLLDLPYQLETKFFYLAHGIYIHDGAMVGERNTQSTSLWGCPVLLGLPHEEWNVDFNRFSQVTSFYKKSIVEYAKYFKDKPLFLGHFWPKAVKENLDLQGIKDYKYDDKGFISFENINWVDSDVLHSYPFGTPKVKVISF